MQKCTAPTAREVCAGAGSQIGVNTGNTPRLAPHYLNTYPRAALPQYLSSRRTTALPSSILPLPILQGLGHYREKVPFWKQH